ncbi:MAG: hypothetical protein ACTTHG_04965 [Treponemataceae bacterium]
MYKKIFCVLFSLFTIFSLKALEFELGVGYENFSATDVVGVDLYFRENLSDEFLIIARAENKYNYNYKTYCGSKFETEIFGIMAGVLFDARDNLFTPGVIFDAEFKFPKKVTLNAVLGMTFSPSNIFNLALVDVEGKVIIHRANFDASLSYEFSRYAIGTNEKINHSGGIDVLAFAPDFPFKMGVSFGAQSSQDPDDKTSMDAGMRAGTRLIFDFGKAGCYTLKGECEVWRLSRKETYFPFFASASVKFRFN